MDKVNMHNYYKVNVEGGGGGSHIFYSMLLLFVLLLNTHLHVY